MPQTSLLQVPPSADCGQLLLDLLAHSSVISQRKEGETNQLDFNYSRAILKVAERQVLYVPSCFLQGGRIEQNHYSPEAQNMKTKFYKIITGSFQEIIISEEELPKAMWSFVNNEGCTFADGACSKINDIIPEKAMSMGWNRGYKPKSEDYPDINRELGRSLENLLVETKLLCSKVNSLPELESAIAQYQIGGRTMEIPKELTAGIGKY